MRLINADALMETINRHCYPVQHDMTSIEPGMTRIGILQAIQEQPTVEPERKKGKWIHGREMAREMIRDCTTAIFYEGWTCSECGCLVEKEREPWYKYCPNCGSYNGGDKDDQR